MIYSKDITSSDDLLEIFHFLSSFDKRVLLVVKEAGFNILKHAKRGKFKLFKIKNGYKLLFEDENPYLDIKKAFIKGYSSAKTLGIGLNLIVNVVDDMEIHLKENKKEFVFYIYEKERVEYCVFKKEFEDIKAYLKVSPFISVTTNGDCGIFEKIGKRYIFALWDIAGHGSREVYNASKRLKKLINAFKEFPLEESIEVIEYLFDKEAALVLGEIKKSMRFYHFGNIRYFYQNRAYYKESPYLKEGKGKLIELKRDNIIFFSDGIDIKKEILSYEELSEVIREKKDDDASVLVIRM